MRQSSVEQAARLLERRAGELPALRENDFPIPPHPSRICPHDLAPCGANFMSRKSLFLTLGLIMLAGGSIMLILALMIFHEPEFYRRAGVPAGEQRRRWSYEFREELNNLINSIINYKT